MNYDGWLTVKKALVEYSNNVTITDPGSTEDIPFVSIRIGGLDPAKVLNTLAKAGLLEEPEPLPRRHLRPVLEPIFAYAGGLVFRDVTSADPLPHFPPSIQD